MKRLIRVHGKIHVIDAWTNWYCSQIIEYHNAAGDFLASRSYQGLDTSEPGMDTIVDGMIGKASDYGGL